MIPQLSPDLEHYLKTNRPPLEVDIAKARETLRVAQSLLLDLGGVSGSSAFQVRPEELRQLVLNCNIILSPIRRLPLDIVRTILLACLPTAWENNDPFADPPDPLYSTQGSFDIRLAPWVLSHVSSTWRSISLSMSPLWSHLTICMPRLIHRHARKPFPILDILDTHLQRSNQYPLSINFRITRDSSRFMIDEIFSRLLPQSNRWQRLCLEADDALLQNFNKICYLPSLQHLIMIPTTTMPTQLIESMIAPLLRKVSIQRPPPRSLLPFTHLNYPWSQITSFTGASIYAWDVLVHSPNVTEFLGDNTSIELPYPHHSLVHHSNLQKLRCDVAALPWLGALPALMSLRTFDDSSFLDDPGSVPGIVTEFLQRASCSLAILYIEGVRFADEGQVTGLFNLIPYLKELYIYLASSVYWSASHLTTSLTLGGHLADTACVPNLQVLGMDVIDMTGDYIIRDFVYDKLMSIAESRWSGKRGGSSQLRRIELLTFGRPLSHDLRGRIEKMRAEGLEIKERETAFTKPPEYVMR